MKLSSGNYVENKMQQIYTAAEIRAISKSLPIDQDKWEVRFSVGVITLFFIGDMLRSAFYIAFSAATTLLRVAELSRVPGAIAVLMAIAGAMAIPHLWMLAFRPQHLWKTEARQLATYGAVMATLLWLYLAGLAWPLDIGLAEFGYWAKALGCLIVGYLYAHSINSQQNREAIENDKQAVG